MAKKKYGNTKTKFKKHATSTPKGRVARPMARPQQKQRPKYNYNRDAVSVATLGNFTTSSAGTSVRIREREFITDISSGGSLPAPNPQISSYQNNQFNIDPSDRTTFPWLSQIAQAFDTYKFHSCRFIYKTMSGYISTTTVMGSVFAAIQYDVYNATFGSKGELEQYEGAVSCVPSQSLCIDLQCSKMYLPDTHRYTRVTSEPSVQGDNRLYDVGRLEIGSISCPTPKAVLGELWVEYDVELFQKKLVEAAPAYFQAYDNLGVS